MLYDNRTVSSGSRSSLGSEPSSQPQDGATQLEQAVSLAESSRGTSLEQMLSRYALTHAIKVGKSMSCLLQGTFSLIRVLSEAQYGPCDKAVD